MTHIRLKHSLLGVALAAILALAAYGGQGQKKQTAENETQFPLIGNTTGFVSYFSDGGRFRDSLNRIEFLNDDGSEWLSLSSDLFRWPDHIRQGENFREDDLKPWAFMPDYETFVFRCVGEPTAEGYRVVVDEENNIVKQLKAHANLNFETIEEHVLSVIIDTDFDLNPIRESPSDDAPVAQATESEMEVTTSLKLQGEWIRIEDTFSKRILGWIRWKKGDRFMIHMYYLI